MVLKYRNKKKSDNSFSLYFKVFSISKSQKLDIFDPVYGKNSSVY